MASGMLGGMIFAAIPALAKIFFGAYEVVTTLLLNFVAIQLTSYLVLGPLKPTTLTGATATDTFPKQLWLPHILGTSDANVGIYIALIVAVLIAIIMYKTVFGQEVKMVGANERYAKYSGISTARITLFTMLIGGAIAGLAGTTEVLGVIHRLPAGFNLGIGFTGIVVALLAQNNPIGCIISSIFFAALKNGATNMQRISDIPSSVSEIVQAMVILMVTIEILLPAIRNRVRSPKISGPVKKTTSSQGGEKDA